MTEEEKKAKRRAYYQAHKEEIKTRARKWAKDHREQAYANHRRHYHSNSDKYREYARAYYQAHKEEIAEKRYAKRKAMKECQEQEPQP